MNKNIPKYIVIHCTAYSYASLFDQFIACNGWHKDRGFNLSSLNLYIGYHRLITGDKNYQCRIDSEMGSHCNQGYDGVKVFPPASGALSMNFQSLGICIGFDGDKEYPTPVQLDLLQKQVWEWQGTYNIPNDNVFFHRHFATNKTCPGALITPDWLKQLLFHPAPITTPPPVEIHISPCIEEDSPPPTGLEKILQFITNLFTRK